MDENQVRDQQEDFVQEILDAIRRNLPQDELVEKLSDYHENDIATAFEELTPEERRTLYPILGAERVSEIFSYIDDPNEYLKELDLEKAARVIENMDSDDAIDVLEDLDDSTQEQIVRMMDEEAANDIRIIQSAVILPGILADLFFRLDAFFRCNLDACRMADLLSIEPCGLNALFGPLVEVGDLLLCLIKRKLDLLSRKLHQEAIDPIQDKIHVGPCEGHRGRQSALEGSGID